MADEQDFSLKYDGKVLMIHICINTDQDPNKLAKNIQRIARGPRLDALVCWVEGYNGEDAAKVWAEIQRVIVKASASPNTTPYSMDPGDMP